MMSCFPATLADKERKQKHNHPLDYYTQEIPVPHDLEKLALNAITHYAFKVKDGISFKCSSCGNLMANDPFQISIKEMDIVVNSYYSYTTKKQYEKTIVCPHCKKDLVIREIRKNTNYDKLRMLVQIDLLNRHQDNIYYQRFLIQTYVDQQTKVAQAVKPIELHRKAIIEGESVDVNSYYSWNPTTRWLWQYGNQLSYQGYPDKSIDLYCGSISIHELVAGTVIEKTQISHYLEADTNWQNLSLYSIRAMQQANKYKWVEYLWKGNMRNLFDDVIKEKANMNKINPKMIMKYRKQIQRTNANASMCELMRYAEKQRKIELSDEFLLKFQNQAHVSSKDYKECFINVWKQMNHDIDFLKYATKQDIYSIIFYYADYLNMVKEIHGDGELPSNIRYPKNLKQAHDEIAKKHREMQQVIEDGKFEKAMRDKLNLQYQDEKIGLAVIVPMAAVELVNESKVLNHCVSSYVRQVVNGFTTILFVRSLEHIDEPFITVEYRDGTIKQARGRDNKPAEEEVMNFLDVWKRKIAQREMVQANA